MAPDNLDRIESLNNSIPLSFRARHRNSAVLSINDRPSHRSVRSQRYGFDDYTDDRRFDLLRVLACYQVRTLLVEPDFESHEKWIWRERLGVGGSFAVHEATLPISSVFSGRLRYRDFKVKGSNQGPVFQDHTLATWSHGSNVAFKTNNVDPDSIITELRVLCHEPFQDHPNIVHLIGIAWITDHSSQGNTGRREVLEWPAILLEKAPYGSLSDFLIASGSGMSLKTKVLLCVEVLKAIKDLHACGIVHCDVKVHNALVFDSSVSTAESWRVKLADFGNAILLTNEAASNERVLNRIPGTPFYRPPEADKPSLHVTVRTVTAIDIWGWGLLLWQVIIGGGSYIDEEGNEINEEVMETIRDQDSVAHVAWRSCSKFMRLNHFHEQPRFRAGLQSALLRSLSVDPSQRPTAVDLLDRLQNMLSEHHATVFRPAKTKAIASLPSFDVGQLGPQGGSSLIYTKLLDHYYNLEFLNTIPDLIYKSLERAAVRGRDKASHEALLQLGLCNAVGFGVPQDTSTALLQIKKAAGFGLPKAQAIVFRMHAALGVPVSQGNLTLMLSWLKAAARTRSTIALTDLRKLDVESFYRTVRDLTSPDTQTSVNDRFRDAIQFGNLDSLPGLLEQGASLSWKDESGATCLYWVSTCWEDTAPLITTLLIDHGADVNVKTRRVTGIGKSADDHHYLNTVPPQSTPLEWAIMQDNLPVLKVLIEASIRTDSTFFHDDMESTPIGCASRFQSQKCLAWLCDLNSPEAVRDFDGYGFSSLYYALRPDILDRMLRFPLCTRRVEGYVPRALPVVEREVEVIKTLLDSGANLAVHKDDAFTCLHLATAFAHPKVLDIMLTVSESTHLLEALSDEQYPPLKDALFRADIDIFTMIIQGLLGASSLWCGPKYHAIHLCCTILPATCVAFAGLLYDKDSLCLHSTSKPNCASPLHIAASQGNSAMIEFLVSHGAPLLCGADGLTPLAWAIRSRSVEGVDALCNLHQLYGIPKVATWGYYKDGQAKVRGVAAIALLLTPGKNSPRLPRNETWQTDLSGIGCYDHPFSEVSQTILGSLLDLHRSAPVHDFHWLRFWQHPTPPFTPISPWSRPVVLHRFIKAVGAIFHRSDEFGSGLECAIRLGNLTATKMILSKRGQGRYNPALRDLIDEAPRGIECEETCFASQQDRRDVYEYLQQLQREEFETARAIRQGKAVLRIFWTLYYSAYGNHEQGCFERCYAWLSQWPSDDSLPWPLIIFRPWCRLRIPISIIALAVLWAMLIPLFKYHSTLRHAIDIPYSTKTLGAPFGVAILAHILLIWPAIFRLTSIICLCGQVEPRYSPGLRLLQYLVIISVITISTGGAMITSLIGIDLLDLPLCHNRSTDSCEDFFSSLGPSFDAIKNPVGLLAAWFAVNGVIGLSLIGTRILAIYARYGQRIYNF